MFLYPLKSYIISVMKQICLSLMIFCRRVYLAQTRKFYICDFKKT